MNKKSYLVIGDLMLDKYCYCDANRISPEAPVPVLKYNRTKMVLGGAANVACNLAANGQNVSVLGVVGKDGNADTVLSLLKAGGIDTSLVIVDESRPTTCKTRFVAMNQQVFRFDEEDSTEISSALSEAMISRLKTCINVFDLVVISDYNKGLLSQASCQELISIARNAGVSVIVDPKSTLAGKYNGCTLIKPNKKELLAFSDIGASTVQSVTDKAIALKEHIECEYVLVTLGAAGMLFVDSDNNVRSIESAAREVFDVTGAGDTVLAFIAMGFENGSLPYSAVETANLAAGVKVGKFGTSIVTYDELSAGDGLSHKICSLTAAGQKVDKLRSAGKKIVFTNGCFDILHSGHVTYLEKARELGDVLVVGLNTDASVKRLKGPDRPILEENERSRILASLASVDIVVLFDEDSPIELIRTLKPDVLVKGGDYKIEDIVGYKEVIAGGGIVTTIPLVTGRSTTNVIEKIKEIEARHER